MYYFYLYNLTQIEKKITCIFTCYAVKYIGIKGVTLFWDMSTLLTLPLKNIAREHRFILMLAHAYIRMHALHIHMYVCTYAPLHARMYVRMYTYIYTSRSMPFKRTLNRLKRICYSELYQTTARNVALKPKRGVLVAKKLY